MYYPDANDDGIVDGYGLAESSLNVYHFNGAQWVPQQDMIRSPGENWVEGTTGSFSGFGVGGFASGGGGGGGICLVGNIPRRASAVDTLILMGIGALLLMQLAARRRCRTM